MSELWGDKDPGPPSLWWRFLAWCDDVATCCEGLAVVILFLCLMLGWCVCLFIFTR